MSHERFGRPHLEVVRDPEEMPLDVKVIEAYCDELLIDKDGNTRNYAFHSWTPLRHAEREWSRAVFRRDHDGYILSLYNEAKHPDPLFEDRRDLPVYEVVMSPFSALFPGRKAPRGAEWFIQAGKPELSAPHVQSYEPAYFRIWLEEIWGPLPRSIQKKLGIAQRVQPAETLTDQE